MSGYSVSIAESLLVGDDGNRSQAGDWLIFSALRGLKNVPVHLAAEGDSPIFADCAAKIATVPVNGYATTQPRMSEWNSHHSGDRRRQLFLEMSRACQTASSDPKDSRIAKMTDGRTCHAT